MENNAYLKIKIKRVDDEMVSVKVNGCKSEIIIGLKAFVRSLVTDGNLSVNDIIDAVTDAIGEATHGEH